MKSRNLAILQPFIPHYRTDFFKELGKLYSTYIYIYEPINKVKQEGFFVDDIKSQNIPNIQYKGVLLYNPFKILRKNYDTLVLMLHFAHITTWLLLITKFIHRKKIILWGHGISVKRYTKEEKSPHILLKWMLALSDGAWIYTEKEAKDWQKIFPNKKIVGLNNTLSGTTSMIEYKSLNSKENLRCKYNIKEKVILIFCARFNNPHRRTDLLIDTINKLDKERFGFIIIGDGKYKPDFSVYSNVYDYGAIYDNSIKQELFNISDLYFQPAWVGLSIVEAMAYGKPICTFNRDKEVLQCVEFSYIKDGENGLIFNNTNDLVKKTERISYGDIERMGENAKLLVKEKLTIENMVKNAISIL